TGSKISIGGCQQYITELNSISGFTLQVRYIQALTGLYSKLLSCDFYHCKHNFFKIRSAKVRNSNSKKQKTTKKTVKTVLITVITLLPTNEKVQKSLIHPAFYIFVSPTIHYKHESKVFPCKSFCPLDT